jgi:colicin import membrane protein
VNRRRVSSRPDRWQELRQSAAALGLAVLVHLAGFGMLWLGSLDWQPRKPPPVAAFTLVDTVPMIEAERREQETRQREQEAERQAEAARQRLEQARREEQARQQALAADQQRQREERDRAAALEQQRQQQLERERAAAREVETRRLAEQARRDAEQQRMRELEDLRRQRQQAEAEREAQERRMAELAERREVERREAEAAAAAERLRLAQQQAAQTERRATLRDEYVVTIQELVRRNWIRPPTTRPGVRCNVRVVQIPGGEIIDQTIAGACNADESTRRSILAAVERTATLPYRGYEDVFQRDINFVFRYDGD